METFKKTLGFIIILGSGLLVGYFVGKVFISSGSAKTGDNSIPILLLNGFLALYLVLIIHEVGHVIGGKLVGFKFLFLTVGPLSLLNNESKLKLALNNDVSLFGGIAGCMPDSTENLPKKMLVYILGGPGASLLFALLFLGINYLILDSTNLFLLISGFGSGGIFIASIIPGKASGFKTDGAQALIFMRGGNEAEYTAITSKIMTMTLSGTRPKDWSQTEVDKLKSIAPDVFEKVIAELFQYSIHLDNKKFEEAENILKSIEPDILATPKMIQNSFYLEMSFLTSFLQNDTNGVEYYSKIKSARFPFNPPSKCRAEAAVEFVNKNYEEAKLKCENGLRLIDKMIDKGSAKLEYDLLHSIIDECNNHLK
ncbi:MAG: hypothetical protein K9J12_17650 [Melioribacteraceae bacterium]|nr:hypothetical protein [Melioribacteraceae bacterium]MCF8263027.1 hypothetical protein [Melioribacteraceae bacterium]MCF8430472.1 hypothetical protein [Melioribacteraceae bacterium]